MAIKNYIFITAFIVLIIPTFSSANIHSQYFYNVHVGNNLDHFDVDICFTTTPKSTHFSLEQAQTFSNIRLHSPGTQTIQNINSQNFDTLSIKKGDCISYTARFTGDITYPRFKERQSTRDQIMVSLGQWLWKPSQQTDTPAIVNFYIPEQYDVSAPGKLISKSPGKHTYQFLTRSGDWEGCIAIGRFKVMTRHKNSANIHIALLNGKNTFKQHDILQWVDANLAALYQVYNELPVNDLQILIVPIGRDREPVPWGQLMRGGGDAVHLYIDETRPLQEFLDDWVMTHELSHLLHPRLSGESKWLSEGIASYYQNVLRARSGLLTIKQAWEKMNAGFQRGARGTSSLHSLEQDSESMSRNRAFMRVYWSGAAISLMADTQLRLHSNNRQSLDTVLKQFKDCCLPMQQQWTALNFMKKLDELTKTGIFTQLYLDYANARYFPNVTQTYTQLSLKRDHDHLLFNETGNNEWKKIMQSTF